MHFSATSLLVLKNKQKPPIRTGAQENFALVEVDSPPFSVEAVDRASRWIVVSVL